MTEEAFFLALLRDKRKQKRKMALLLSIPRYLMGKRFAKFGCFEILCLIGFRLSSSTSKTSYQGGITHVPELCGRILYNYDYEMHTAFVCIFLKFQDDFFKICNLDCFKDLVKSALILSNICNV